MGVGWGEGVGWGGGGERGHTKTLAKIMFQYKTRRGGLEVGGVERGPRGLDP